MACQKKDELLRAYDREMEQWIKSVTAMSANSMAGSAEVLDMLTAVDRSRVKVLEAKSAFVKHTTEHGCLAMSAVSGS